MYGSFRLIGLLLLLPVWWRINHASFCNFIVYCTIYGKKATILFFYFVYLTTDTVNVNNYSMCRVEILFLTKQASPARRVSWPPAPAIELLSSIAVLSSLKRGCAP